MDPWISYWMLLWGIFSTFGRVVGWERNGRSVRSKEDEGASYETLYPSCVLVNVPGRRKPSTTITEKWPSWREHGAVVCWKMPKNWLSGPSGLPACSIGQSLRPVLPPGSSWMKLITRYHWMQNWEAIPSSIWFCHYYHMSDTSTSKTRRHSAS